jgi:hypothetical protein
MLISKPPGLRQLLITSRYLIIFGAVSRKNTAATTSKVSLRSLEPYSSKKSEALMLICPACGLF